MELTFELRVRREAYTRERGKLIRNSERDKTLPETPTWYRLIRGTYKRCADEANKLNEAQKRSGFLDYLFFPEVVTFNHA